MSLQMAKWQSGPGFLKGIFAWKMLFSLAIGTLGGGLFYRLSLPLPWMLGAMTSVLIAALMRLPVTSTRKIRPPMSCILGVTLGSSFTPDMVRHIGDWALLSCISLMVTVATGILGYCYLRRIAGLDPVTAYFAGMSAGVYEMTAQGGRAGGDERRIALVQASRVALIVFCIPMLLDSFYDFGTTAGLTLNKGHFMSSQDALILLAAALIGWPLAHKLRFPNPPLIGPMLLSAAAHAAGLTEAAPPVVLIAIAQVVLGTSIGGQFLGTDKKLLLTSILHSLLLVPLMISLSLIGAFVAHRFAGMDFANSLLALAPAGTTEMALVALALKGEVAIVVFHQILRQISVNFFAPIIFRSQLGKATNERNTSDT